MATVAFVQRRLPHYRVPLLVCLRDLLAPHGVTFRFLHGDPTKAEGTKLDGGSLDWAETLPTRYFAGDRLCWQPFHAKVKDCDLVIVSQENKLVNNLTCLFNPFRRYRFAFLGHGANLQTSEHDSGRERFKRWTNRRADWWFPYTQDSADRVLKTGFPSDRISVLDNSIDTTALRLEVDQTRMEGQDDLRARLGLGHGPLGLFLGSLYRDKLLPQLIETAVVVQGSCQDFTLAIGGDGPERERVQRAAAQYPFIRYFGAVRGTLKAQLLATADVVLNPGLVGLGILDAFAASRPLLTMDCGLHSPEIAYLEPEANGIMTASSIQGYSRAVLDLLGDTARLQMLQAGARASGSRYTVQRMAENFSNGILRCLDRPR